jgi:4-amino-4-deoxychorismate lyase
MCDIQQLFPINEFENGEVSVAKVIITRGEGERGYAPPAVTIPTRVLIKSAMPTYADIHYTQGVHLHLCDTRLALQPKLAGIKHLNRLENVLARMEWREESIFDGLMLDSLDNVIECTMSNIFVRVGSHLYTPDLSQCGVAGITRQRILGLENLLGLTCSVAILTLPELLDSDEVIICNSLYGAFQVSTLGNQTWKQQTLASAIRNILTHG